MARLRIVSRPGSDMLYVRGAVRRQSVFESTGTSDPERAEAYRAKREAELWDSSVFGQKAVVTFAHAVASYLETDIRSAATCAYVEKLLDHFGTSALRTINQTSVDRAYKAILTPGAGGATKLRAVLTPLRAILEHAARRGWCERPAFETPRLPKPSTPFLRPDQATALVRGAAPHLRPLLVFLIGTGARMSEALELDWAAVDLVGARAVVRQKQGTERHIDLPPVVIAALAALPDRKGRVFRPARHNCKELGDAYRDTGRAGGGQIKTAWGSACAAAGLPGEWKEWLRKDRPGKTWRRFMPTITPHAVRHTWATWHYCVHRDLLQLRDDGGWETVKMVERYAKKMPDAYRAQILAWWGARAESVQPASEEGKTATRSAV
jgi:integrase